VTITATYSGDSTHAVSSGTSSLTVLTSAQATQNLITLLGSMNLDRGLTNSLDAKLRAATSSLNKGNPTAAKNQLNAFMNEVSAKCCNKPPGKPLTTSQASLLIADAKQIIQAIP
jgi:FIMAH domain-containing protein